VNARTISDADADAIAERVVLRLHAARRPKKPRRVLPQPTAADVERVRRSLRKRGARV
jgi:hypothetical protein